MFFNWIQPEVKRHFLHHTKHYYIVNLQTMELYKEGVWNRKLIEHIIVSNLVILWLVLSSGMMDSGNQI